ncbi:sigma-54 interaction domain-containing protein [Bacillus sp. 1P06AnD]|uniref:sigma-54 interaction domain-containing protein n=1 Tax=Bacillus sp. 1P06AnD TaxID=3132208 RepID=UPI0039A2EAF7
MLESSIGQLIRDFVDGVIVLNEHFDVMWYDLSEELPLQTINEILACIEMPLMFNDKTPLTIGNKKMFVEMKEFVFEGRFIVLCIEDATDITVNAKNRLYCLERIMDSLDEGVMMSDYSGRMVLYNNAQEKMEGLNSQELLGKHLWSVYNYNPQYSEHQHTLKTGKPILSRYRAHSKINGVPRYVNYSTYPIKKEEETIAVFSISTNESKLKDLLHQTIELKRNRTQEESDGKKIDNGTIFTFNHIKGKSMMLKNVIQEAQAIAVHNTNVLIVGETGTGKELFAQSMHNHSSRCASPFVAINCAAIPENLLESTLFGTVKGAFTGAINQAGLFEYAKDGTLFLDEINSMPMSLQSKLMRVLQEKTIRKIGAHEDIPITCTVLSSTNEDPEVLIAEERMRLDLFYRIAHSTLYLPPLRERTEDIPYYLDYFLKTYSKTFSKFIPKLSKPLLSLLIEYPWPGNTRELEHLVENIMIRVKENDEVIEVEHLPAYIRRKIIGQTVPRKEVTTPFKELFKKPQEHFIKTTLEQSDWNISKAAKLLGIKRQSLQYHMKKLNISKENQ